MNKENNFEISSQPISQGELDEKIFNDALSSQPTQDSVLVQKFGGLMEFTSSQNQKSIENIIPLEDTDDIDLFPSQDSDTDLSQDTVVNQQLESNDDLQNTLNNNNDSPDPFWGYPQACNSLSLHAPTQHSIPLSQKTNYFNPSNNKKTLFPETPPTEASQDDEDKDLIFTQINESDQPIAAKSNQNNEDDEVDTDETDEIAASDEEENETSALVNKSSLITPNDSGKNFGKNLQTSNKLIENVTQLEQPLMNYTNQIKIVNQNTKLAKNVINQQVYATKPKGKYYSICDNDYNINDENRLQFKSIGKSTQAMNLLEAGKGDYSEFDANYDENEESKGKGKSDDNFENNGRLYPFEAPYVNQSYNQQLEQSNLNQPFNQTFYQSDQSYCNQPCNYKSIDNQQYNNQSYDNQYYNQPIYNVNFDKNYSFGKLTYGKEMPNNPYCVNNNPIAINNSTHFNQDNQLNFNNNALDLRVSKGSKMIPAPFNNYIITNQRIEQPTSIGKNYYQQDYQSFDSTNDLYDTRSNDRMSVSTTPISFAPTDELNEDSNDSVSRKRKPMLVVQTVSKVSKLTKDGLDENVKLHQSDETKEMKNLSQQLKETNIDSPSNQFDDSNFEFFDQLSDYFSNKSSNKPSSINILSSCSAQRQETREDNLESAFSSSNLPNLESLDNNNNGTPEKPEFGPRPKSSIKKMRKSNKKTARQNDQLIRKPPVQRRLNISETVTKPIRSSARQQSKSFESVESIETPASKPSTSRTRERTSSVTSCSSSLYTADESEDLDDYKKTRRRSMNNESARNYRMRQKEKEKELDENIVKVQKRYNELISELKRVLTIKHSLIMNLAPSEDDDSGNGFKLPEDFPDGFTFLV